MKTTLEIPDALFQRARAKAAEHKIPLRMLVPEAIAEKLASPATAASKARLKVARKLRHLRRETARINKLIRDEFEEAVSV
ncbi:MAG: hypothetical protein DMG21_15485 [Acidobacteria bacterium]|nr:MAG: hypothetical protein DMG21_15485 [Acidobacteriota bacterium]